AAAVLVALVSACSLVRPSSLRSSGRPQVGHASWYGRAHHGLKTANGEVFNQNHLTAAHPSLPFGTRVRVTNLKNGKSVVVRVNDRGPYVRGRIIDLSAAAARALKIGGVAKVRLEPLK
ncbi:MAG: septal ring lytic transglycosylase RlpA family protein, partial [Candidatus Binatia bacterium]